MVPMTHGGSIGVSEGQRESSCAQEGSGTEGAQVDWSKGEGWIAIIRRMHVNQRSSRWIQWWKNHVQQLFFPVSSFGRLGSFEICGLSANPMTVPMVTMETMATMAAMAATAVMGWATAKVMHRYGTAAPKPLLPQGSGGGVSGGNLGLFGESHGKWGLHPNLNYSTNTADVFAFFVEYVSSWRNGWSLLCSDQDNSPSSHLCGHDQPNWRVCLDQTNQVPSSVIKHGWQENPPFMNDIPIQTYGGFLN